MWRLFLALSLATPPLTRGGHSVAAGGHHSLFLQDTAGGSVIVAGWNTQGQLCNPEFGDEMVNLSPLQDMTLLGRSITSVAAGANYSVLILNDSTILVCGSNAYGELGTGGGLQQATFPTPALSNLPGSQTKYASVREVAAGINHTIFLTTAGEVWTVGRNDRGQLCNGNTEDSTVFHKSVFAGARAVAAGRSHTLLLSDYDSGKVYACGDNSKGQLGTGDSEPLHLTAQEVLSDVRGIAAGYDHSLFLLKNGSVLGVGDNSLGQLGMKAGPGRMQVSKPTLVPGLEGQTIIGVVAGGHHSLFLGKDGQVWGTGENDHGQLGDDSMTTRWGIVRVATPSGPVKDMATGPYHSIFVGENRIAYSTGRNSHGQLGVGSKEDQDDPQMVLNSIAAQAHDPWRSHGPLQSAGQTTTTTTSSSTEDESWPGLAWWQWLLLCSCLLIPFCLAGGVCIHETAPKTAVSLASREERAEANRAWSRSLNEMDLSAEESRPMLTPNGAY
mmetsp:Transcript_43225/g.101677  ORF Transcript_43225/g.101677 Transcript_43225/m.101677 type:complete len:499 (+) Transcript_43225:54-1550(+)